MKIKINKANEEKVQAAIDKAEGRAYAHCVLASEVLECAIAAENRLGCRSVTF